jgi:glycosyltransferase 2 family protein
VDHFPEPPETKIDNQGIFKDPKSGYWLIIAGRIFSGISIFYLGILLYKKIPDLSLLHLHPGLGLSCAGTVAFFCATFYLLCVAWRILLSAGSIHISVRESYEIIGRMQLAKYIPGNVFQYAGRVFLAKRYGVPPGAVMMTMGLEIAAIAATACLIVFLGYSVAPLPIPEYSRVLTFLNFGSASFWIISGLILVAGMVLAIRYFRKWFISHRSYIQLVTITSSMILYAGMFVFTGWFIQMIQFTGWGTPASLPWYQFSWGYTCAWLSGFFVPGAPGGLGVRELVFVGLFRSACGEGTAVGLAVILRLVSSVSDLVTYAIAAMMAVKKNLR